MRNDLEENKQEYIDLIDILSNIQIASIILYEGYSIDDIENEIEYKKKYLQSDLDSNGENRYFLIALHDGKIIGSIEYGSSSELINSCTDGAFNDLVEIGTVFVRPDYQRRGIGNLLLNVMYLTLQNRGIE